MALHICPTPIGNIKDITIRVIETLEQVDYIAAEDTRWSKKLLNHYNINTKLLHYDDHHENKTLEKVILLLEEGHEIAFICDAGTPLVSDPGTLLIKECILRNIPVNSLPGPSAFLTALVSSGLDTNSFTFYGFAPRKEGQRNSFLSDIALEKNTLVFYEAPHRLIKLLTSIKHILGKRNIVVARELTKYYEEIIRCTTDEVLDKFSEENLKGEFVVIVEGYKGKDNKNISIEEELIQYIKSGISKKDAIKILSKERGISKREIYKKSIDIDLT